MIKGVNELSLEGAKALLGEKKIPDEKLLRVLEQVKMFCKVTYQLYAKQGGAKNTSDNVRQIYSEPPDQFTNAA